MALEDQLYLFTLLLGMYALYEGKGCSGSETRHYLRMTHRCLLASFCFAAAALIKPQRGLPLALIILFHMGHKVLDKAGHFAKLFKYLITAAQSLALILGASFFTAMWMPYKVYCEPHRNRSNVMADFCTNSWPMIPSTDTSNYDISLANVAAFLTRAILI